MKANLYLGWLIHDHGYCILMLGSCPPEFTEASLYNKSNRYGEYIMIKHNEMKQNEERYAMRVRACCN